MNTRDILLEVDAEIVRLQQVRQLLEGSENRTVRKGGKRLLSPEARERIAAAQRKRWAAQKRDSAGLTKGAVKRSARPAKRVMSADARARIGAATRARWAAGKQGKQSRGRLRRLAAETREGD